MIVTNLTMLWLYTTFGPDKNIAVSYESEFCDNSYDDPKVMYYPLKLEDGSNFLANYTLGEYIDVAVAP